MNQINNSQPILIIEDSPEDYEAIIRAFKKSGLVNPIHHCPDGDTALDFLYNRRNYSNKKQAPKPGLILIDLNLPGTDGREVLKTIKRDESLKLIPAIVLTTSSDPRDIKACYKLGANSYVLKPVDLNGLFKAIQRMKDYWFEINIIPKLDTNRNQ